MAPKRLSTSLPRVLIPELSALVDAVVALLLVLASAVPVLGVA
jgi:hypothetical protein